jgi:hypothetical protein
VRTVSILSQGSAELVGRDAGLGEDRPEQARPDRLAGVERDGHPAAASWVTELGVRSLLGDNNPSEGFEGADDLSAGDAGEWRHAERR